MNNTCKVQFCKFYDTHVTAGHKCGTCKNYGHGQYECNYLSAKNKLIPYLIERLTEEQSCKFAGCIDKYKHTTEAHHCNKCNGRLHSTSTCSSLLEVFHINCPLCKTLNILSLNDKIYGIEDTCKVCLDNSIELLLPNCKHACLCINCTKIMSSPEKYEYLRYIVQLSDIDNFIEPIIKQLFKDTPSYTEIYNTNAITIIRRLNKNASIEVIKIPSEINFNYTDFIDGYEKIDN